MAESLFECVLKRKHADDLLRLALSHHLRSAKSEGAKHFLANRNLAGCSENTFSESDCVMIDCAESARSPRKTGTIRRDEASALVVEEELTPGLRYPQRGLFSRWHRFKTQPPMRTSSPIFHFREEQNAVM